MSECGCTHHTAIRSPTPEERVTIDALKMWLGKTPTTRNVYSRGILVQRVGPTHFEIYRLLEEVGPEREATR